MITITGRFLSFLMWLGGKLPVDKLEFGGESPRTMRARCSGFRNCPDPLGIVTAKQLDKFGILRRVAADNTCSVQWFSLLPCPLSIVTAEQLGKLEFVKLFLLEKTYNSFRPMDK